MVKTQRLIVPFETFCNMLDWCVEQYGSTNESDEWAWQTYAGLASKPFRYDPGNATVEFSFKYEEDKFHFLLVFSHV